MPLPLFLLSYQQDYDETYPTVRLANSGPASNVEWFDEITPYVKNTQISFCPSAGSTGVSTSNTTYTNSNYGFIGNVIGYVPWGNRQGFNLPGGGTCPAAPSPVTLASVATPAERIFVADAANYDTEVHYWYRTDNTTTPTAQEATDHGGAYYWVDGARHLGGANCGFLDGHAKWFPATYPYRKDVKPTCAGPINYYRTD